MVQWLRTRKGKGEKDYRPTRCVTLPPLYPRRPATPLVFREDVNGVRGALSRIGEVIGGGWGVRGIARRRRYRSYLGFSSTIAPREALGPLHLGFRGLGGNHWRRGGRVRGELASCSSGWCGRECGELEKVGDVWYAAGGGTKEEGGDGEVEIDEVVVGVVADASDGLSSSGHGRGEGEVATFLLLGDMLEDDEGGLSMMGGFAESVHLGIRGGESSSIDELEVSWEERKGGDHAMGLLSGDFVSEGEAGHGRGRSR